MKRISSGMFLLPFSCALIIACDSTPGPTGNVEPSELKPAIKPSPRTDFSDPPPNSPAPPASCGDMNGGGDQHVDFMALFEAKTAEKPAVEQRQQALLE